MLGAAELVLELGEMTRIAVASNTPGRLVRGALACAGPRGSLRDRGHGRPGRRAQALARRLSACVRAPGAPPPRSIALEDSPTGVAAAHAAGMYVIGIPSFPGVTHGCRRPGREARSPTRSCGLLSGFPPREGTAATPAVTRAIPSSRPGVIRMLVEPHPAEVVDDERGDHLPDEDEDEEHGRAELRRGHHRAEYVEAPSKPPAQTHHGALLPACPSRASSGRRRAQPQGARWPPRSRRTRTSPAEGFRPRSRAAR